VRSKADMSQLNLPHACTHTIFLQPVCSLLLADCDDTRCEVTSRLLFSVSFCYCFTTIFTVVLAYVRTPARRTSCAAVVESSPSMRWKMSVARNVICWRRLTGLFPSDTPGCDRVVFLACVHLTLFLALSISPDNSLVSSWCDHSMLASSL